MCYNGLHKNKLHYSILNPEKQAKLKQGSPYLFVGERTASTSDKGLQALAALP